MREPKLTLRQKTNFVLSGIFLSLLIIEIGLRLAGWIALSVDNIKNNNARSLASEPNSTRLLCMGACYTVGVGVMPEEAYPFYLEQILNRQNKPGQEAALPQHKFVVINRGVRGKNLSFFVDSLEYLLKKYRPRVVVLNINERVDVYNDNLLMANKELLSHSQKFKIRLGALLKKLKVYQLASLLFAPEESGTLREWNREGMVKAALSDKHSFYGHELNVAGEEARKNPANYSSWEKLANAYERHGLYELAAESIQKATELNPKCGSCYLELFWFNIMLGKYEKALELRKKALDAEPEIVERLRATIGSIEEEVAAHPLDSRKLLKLSRYYIFLGEYQKAKDICERALSFMPRYGSGYERLKFLQAVVQMTDNLNPKPGIDLSRQETSLYFNEDNNDLSAFTELLDSALENAKGKNKAGTLNGIELFERLLDYDLSRAKAIAAKYGAVIILENMGSLGIQQEPIKRASAKFNIPLVDLYAVFKYKPDAELAFLPNANVHLNKEGYRLMAEEVYRVLLGQGLLDNLN